MLEEEEFWRVFMLFNTGVGNGRERLYGPLSREYRAHHRRPDAIRARIIFIIGSRFSSPPLQILRKTVKYRKGDVCAAHVCSVASDDRRSIVTLRKDAEGEQN